MFDSIVGGGAFVFGISREFRQWALVALASWLSRVLLNIVVVAE